MWFGNFIFIRCGFAAYHKNGIYPQNYKILKNIYFTIAIEVEDDTNFEPSAHEPTTWRKNSEIRWSERLNDFQLSEALVLINIQCRIRIFPPFLLLNQQHPL